TTNRSARITAKHAFTDRRTNCTAYTTISGITVRTALGFTADCCACTTTDCCTHATTDFITYTATHCTTQCCCADSLVPSGHTVTTRQHKSGQGRYCHYTH